MRHVLVAVVLGSILIGSFAVVAGAGSVPQRAADPVAGQKIYVAQKCNICHVIAGSGGKLGPDLSGIGLKRTAGWFEKYLPDPRAFNPKGKMPAQSIKGQDLKDLSAYLATLKTK